ncbi:hypothetical protein HY628_00620 [Candidatus Uhrbacteria bacterium]|nr:hypothetical protein [Candidatus Uhrbacteria bacterium]
MAEGLKKYRKSEILAMRADDCYALGKHQLKIPGIAGMGDDQVLERVLIELSERNLLIDDGEALAPTGSAEPLDLGPPAPVKPKGVRAVYGIHDQTLTTLVGMTVAEAVISLRELFSIERNPLMFVNGREVKDQNQVRLEPGDTLEMQKSASVKGSELNEE